MMLSDDGLRFIADCEGKHEAIGDGRYRAYQCVVGYKNGKPIYDGKWTIYTGLTNDVHEGMIVTEAEGEAMFRRELTRFEAAVNKLVKVPLSQAQFDSLVSFAFNCGETALARSTLLKKLNRGNYEGAARALYAADRDLFHELSEPWPADLRDHARSLAEPAFALAPGARQA